MLICVKIKNVSSLSLSTCSFSNDRNKLIVSLFIEPDQNGFSEYTADIIVPVVEKQISLAILQFSGKTRDNRTNEESCNFNQVVFDCRQIKILDVKGIRIFVSLQLESHGNENFVLFKI